MLNSDEESPPNEAIDEINGVRETARRVISIFVIPPDRNLLSSRLDEWCCGHREPYSAIGRAFCANIDGLLSTISIPYQLAAASSQDRHWQRISSAERIRALMIDTAPSETTEELTSRRDQEALVNANFRMKEFVNSSEGKDYLVKDTLGFLDRSTRVDSFVQAALDLIFQGLVLCWSTFEVLARDCFIAYLNNNPQQIKSLLSDSVAKRRFDISKVSLEVLAAYNFDLSSSLGNFLAQQQDLSDLLSIKAVYEGLFPHKDEMQRALCDDNLRLLSLRRNLTVHQRGIIDKGYVVATSCEQPVGARLKVSPEMLEGHLESVVKAASAILAAVAA